MNQEMIDWLSLHLLPFEAELRRRLRRVCDCDADAEDIIQEMYCKIMEMNNVAHVAGPRGYLVQMAKNLVTDRLRHNAVVHIETMANLHELDIMDEAPGPERIAFGRDELRWVMGLIDKLPDRCREVFRARRLHGLSLRETADSLGVTEKAVDYETTKGMELLSEMMKRHGLRNTPSKFKSRRIHKAGTSNVGDR
jgi:RNA polymerase sigma-70 factor (ECF subfamily)